MIEGGFIVIPRVFYENVLANKSPLFFVVWEWLMLEAATTDTPHLKRGQVFTDAEKIVEAIQSSGLKKPTINNIQDIIETLIEEEIITTVTNHKGTIITICDYDRTQNVDNYEP